MINCILTLLQKETLLLSKHLVWDKQGSVAVLKKIYTILNVKNSIYTYMCKSNTHGYMLCKYFFENFFTYIRICITYLNIHLIFCLENKILFRKYFLSRKIKH